MLISNKLKMATKYAKIGFPLIPLHSSDKNGDCDCGENDCSSPAKHPKTVHGLNDATNDMTIIKKHWRKHPDSNIGIVTGKDSFVVLDIDGNEGRSSLAKLQKQYGRLPETVVSETGNGLHYWFTSDIPIKNSTSKVGNKIDVRGDGGYIVAPPSTHYSGVEYRFKDGHSLDDVDIAKLPEWLKNLMLADKKNIGLTSESPRNLPVKLANNDMIPDGQRNDTLFRFGCSLKRKGVSDHLIKNALQKVNRENCIPQLPENDIDTIAKSIAKYPSGDINQSKEYIDKWFDDNKNKITLGSITEDDVLIFHLSCVFRRSPQDYISIKSKLKKENDFRIRDLDDLQKVVKNHKVNQAYPINNEGLPISLFWDNIPFSKQLLVPNGFVIDETGIRKPMKKDGYEKIITTAPIIIINRFKNILDRKQLVTLAFLVNKRWEKLTVTKSHISETQKLVSLANTGLPVTTNNARDVIDFLYLFLSINNDIIPECEIVSQLGWVGDNFDKGFMYGTNHIPPTGIGKLRDANLQNVNFDQKVDFSPVYFHNPDNGGQSIAAGFSKKGTLRGWLKLLPIIDDNSVLAFMLYGAVTAPLLIILGYPNILIDNSGPTTEGKTTGLEVAISPFGDPKRLIHTWNNTQVYVERTAQMLNGLPMILDDTKLIKDANLISKIIYQGAAGQGRGRGTIDGTSEVTRWNTVILSTGESNILNLINASDGGAHGRVIPVCRTPFPIKNKKNKRLIDEINKITSDNHGLVGLRFIRSILKNKEHWLSWKKEVDKIKREYDSRSKDGIMYRLNTSFAAIEFAAKILCESCGLDLDYKRHMEEIYKIVSHEVSRNANLSQNALQELFDFCISHQDDFYQNDDEKSQPSRGWLGSWENKLAIIPENLKNILKNKGYEPKAIIEEWVKKAYFEKDKSGGNPKVSVGERGRVRCYTFKDSVTNKYISSSHSSTCHFHKVKSLSDLGLDKGNI